MDDSYTTVCYFLQGNIHPLDELGGSIRWSHIDFPHNCEGVNCQINPHPRMILTLVYVRIAGHHIITKPIDSSYNVRIYQKTVPYSDTKPNELYRLYRQDFKNCDFDDFELITEINIAYTENFHDTKILYGDVISKYLKNLRQVNYNTYSFKAVASVESYVKSFGTLDKILQSTADAGGGEKKDCPHVKKRTKRK
jgi:hypothetical protein